MNNFNVLNTELMVARKIFWLIANDYIFLSTYNEEKKDWDDGAYPAINCNDLFVPGADAEGLSAEDLDLYLQVVTKYPNHGTYAWCGVKRNVKLWRHTEDQTWMKAYSEAVIWITLLLNTQNK